MIGSANVNNFYFLYQTFTLIFLALFALYDLRYHKVRNLALLLFLPWCLLSTPVILFTEPLPWSLILLKSINGFIAGGLALLIAAMLTDGGVGGGDIKLTALLGFSLGPARICAVLCFAAVLALVLTKLRAFFYDRTPSRIAFVPYLFVGTLLISFL